MSTDVRGLLISWAMPAASLPMDASFSERIRCCRLSLLISSSLACSDEAIRLNVVSSSPISLADCVSTRTEKSPREIARETATRLLTGLTIALERKLAATIARITPKRLMPRKMVRVSARISENFCASMPTASMPTISPPWFRMGS